VAESSGFGGWGFRRSASAASFCSSMTAAAADSRSGMEFSRWLRDWRVCWERDSRAWNFESRDWDFWERESWREEKWVERVL